MTFLAIPYSLKEVAIATHVVIEGKRAVFSTWSYFLIGHRSVGVLVGMDLGVSKFMALG